MYERICCMKTSMCYRERCESAREYEFAFGFPSELARLGEHLHAELIVGHFARANLLLLSDWDCALHANDQVKGVLVRSYLNIVKQIHSLISLTSTGATFLKRSHFVPKAVNTIVSVENGYPPEWTDNERLYRDELLDYVATRCRPRHRASRAGEMFMDAWRELLLLLNGLLSCGRLVLWCSSNACCAGKRVIVAKTIRALMRCVFVAYPISHELGQWTKFGVAIDHIIMSGCLLFPVYGVMCTMAFAGGPTRRAVAPDQHNKKKIWLGF